LSVFLVSGTSSGTGCRRRPLGKLSFGAALSERPLCRSPNRQKANTIA